MSYAVQSPVPAPVAGSRRPVTVALAAALLALMALIGLGYAVATLAVTPGIVSRFREAAARIDPVGADGYVTVLWVGAAIAAVIGVILFALYAVLALGLRRGSPGARVGTWVVCGLGLLAGCGSALAVSMQGGSDDGLLVALGGSYPAGWVGVNMALSVTQMLGYLLVAVLLAASPRGFFRRPGESPAAPAPVQQYPGGPYPPNPYAAPGGYSAPPPGVPASPIAATPPPEPGPDDQFWARPT
jgi:hypothetical protein